MYTQIVQCTNNFYNIHTAVAMFTQLLQCTHSFYKKSAGGSPEGGGGWSTFFPIGGDIGHMVNSHIFTMAPT